MTASSFGLGTPFTNPVSPLGTSGLSQGIQGLGGSPFSQPQFFGQPFTNIPGSPVQPLQQIVQLLQILPQQLQQLQQLGYVQQQQLQQLQQLVQVIPAQLAQLHQLIQFVPQQILQMQNPLSQGLGAGALGSSPLGISSQIFGAQPGYLM
jgi:hypothetical protein